MKEAVCRLCLADLDLDDCGYSIADFQFRKALERVFTFKISLAADDLHGYTCKQCSWNVLDFQSFSELVQTNQEKLQERSLRDAQNKTIAEQGNTEISAELSYDDDCSEGSVRNDVEPSNSSSEDLECYSHNVEQVYEILPDHMYSSKADPNTNDRLLPVLICEEYLITSNEADASEAYDDADNVFDGIEPPKKKQKIPSRDVTGNENNNLEPCRSDSNNAASKMYPCEQCDKMFDSKWLVEYHKQEHIVSKCMFCKKSVSLKHFNLHMTTHLGDFNCNLCNKKFLSQRDFKCHKKVCKELK